MIGRKHQKAVWHGLGERHVNRSMYMWRRPATGYEKLRFDWRVMILANSSMLLVSARALLRSSESLRHDIQGRRVLNLTVVNTKC